MDTQTLFRVAGTHENVGTSEETTLQLPTAAASVWQLVSFHYVVTGGTAASYTPRLAQVAAWTDDDINERMTFGLEAVANPTSYIFTQPIPVKTDSTGKVYFRPGFDVGADNDGAYEFWFVKARGA